MPTQQELTELVEIEPWMPGETPVLKPVNKPMTLEEAKQKCYSPYCWLPYDPYDSIIVIDPSGEQRYFLAKLNLRMSFPTMQALGIYLSQAAQPSQEVDD